MSTFDKLLEQARIGEELKDPRVGKYPKALLREVHAEVETDYPRLELIWDGLVDGEGEPFEHTQIVWFPRESDLSWGKVNFMTLLKTLKVVPQSYSNLLLFETSKGQEELAAAVQEVAQGKYFALVIKLNKKGRYQTNIYPCRVEE